jgi:hypothetical protein
MERRLFQIVVGLAWLALPLTALKYWVGWDRLPLRVAVHFDGNWQPNGWTSREGSLMLALGITTFLLVIFTIACFTACRTGSSSLSRWALAAVFYVVLGMVYSVNAWIVDRSVSSNQTAREAEWVAFRDLDGSKAVCALSL